MKTFVSKSEGTLSWFGNEVGYVDQYSAATPQHTALLSLLHRAWT
jgi:hypothetical protein